MSANGSVYGVRDGMVQFEPKRDRVANGQNVTDIRIKISGTDTMVDVTIWPEFGQLKDIIKKGDWVAVDGALSARQYTAADGSPAQAFQIAATAIAHVPAYVKPSRQVVQAAPVQAVQAAPVQAVPAQGFPVAETAPAAPVAAPAATAPAPF